MLTPIFRSIVLCGVSAVLGGLVVVWLSDSQQGQPAHAQDRLQPVPQRQPPAAAATLEELTAEERVNISVYERVNRSVVHISTRSARNDFFFDSPQEGSGSGFVLDRRGHVATNNHVVDGAQEVQVTLFDGTTYPAVVIGQDATTDLAVLRLDAPAELLFPIAWGDSTRLRVGQRVLAIGNPFGLERTLTAGIISSLNRTLPGKNRRTLKAMIQIDAAINPGNSGGPLLDTRGRLVGMNTAIASRTGQSSGVGFALPARTIAQVVPQLVEKGRVVRADAGIARVFQTEEGLLIAKLTPGGPAEKAGLQGPKVSHRRRGPFVYQWVDISAADLIVAVDDQKIESADDFLTFIERHAPGEEVELTIVRDGRRMKVRFALASDDDFDAR